MPAASKSGDPKQDATTPPPPEDKQRPGTIGVYVPPDNLPEGEERVDSEEGQPWHTVNRSRELVSKVQHGKVYPMTRAQFDARKAQGESNEGPEGQDKPLVPSEAPAAS